MVKCTGRGLVVKRPGVLTRVQTLNLVLGVGVFSFLPNCRKPEVAPVWFEIEGLCTNPLSLNWALNQVPFKRGVTEREGSIHICLPVHCFSARSDRQPYCSVSHYSAIGDTISCDAPDSTIGFRGKLLLRYPLVRPVFGLR